MARPRLESVKMLRNHGARAAYKTATRRTERYVGPDGLLTVAEASRVLGVPRRQLYRMGMAGLPIDEGGKVAMAIVRALLEMPRGRRGSVDSVITAVEMAVGPRRRSRKARS